MRTYQKRTALAALFDVEENAITGDGETFSLFVGSPEKAEALAKALSYFGAKASSDILSIDGENIAEGSLGILEESGVAENFRAAMLTEGRFTGNLVARRSEFPQATSRYR